jgi:hypothetical protein
MATVSDLLETILSTAVGIGPQDNAEVGRPPVAKPTGRSLWIGVSSTTASGVSTTKSMALTSRAISMRNEPSQWAGRGFGCRARGHAARAGRRGGREIRSRVKGKRGSEPAIRRPPTEAEESGP